MFLPDYRRNRIENDSLFRLDLSDKEIIQDSHVNQIFGFSKAILYGVLALNLSSGAFYNPQKNDLTEKGKLENLIGKVFPEGEREKNMVRDLGLSIFCILGVSRSFNEGIRWGKVKRGFKDGAYTRDEYGDWD